MLQKPVDLQMVRGDTFSFDLVLTDIAAESIRSLYITVKKKATDTDSDAVIQKGLDDGVTLVEGTTYRFRIAPEDTEDVHAGKYVYDIQIRVEDDVYTLFSGAFNIAQDVTEVI